MTDPLNKMPELLNCPFCGGEATINGYSYVSFLSTIKNSSYDVGCESCVKFSHANKGSAIRVWNTRADLSPTKADTGELGRIVRLLERIVEHEQDLNPARSTTSERFAREALRLLSGVDVGKALHDKCGKPESECDCFDRGIKCL